MEYTSVVHPLVIFSITFFLGSIVGGIIVYFAQLDTINGLDQEVDKFRDLYFNELDKWRNKYIDDDDYEAY